MIVVKKTYVTAAVTSNITTYNTTYTDNLVNSVNIIKNNIDSNN